MAEDRNPNTHDNDTLRSASPDFQSWRQRLLSTRRIIFIGVVGSCLFGFYMRAAIIGALIKFYLQPGVETTEEQHKQKTDTCLKLLKYGLKEELSSGIRGHLLSRAPIELRLQVLKQVISKEVDGVDDQTQIALARDVLRSTVSRLAKRNNPHATRSLAKILLVFGVRPFVDLPIERLTALDQASDLDIDQTCVTVHYAEVFSPPAAAIPGVISRRKESNLKPGRPKLIFLGKLPFHSSKQTPELARVVLERQTQLSDSEFLEFVMACASYRDDSPVPTELKDQVKRGEISALRAWWIASSLSIRTADDRELRALALIKHFSRDRVRLESRTLFNAFARKLFWRGLRLESDEVETLNTALAQLDPADLSAAELAAIYISTHEFRYFEELVKHDSKDHARFLALLLDHGFREIQDDRIEDIKSLQRLRARPSIPQKNVFLIRRKTLRLIDRIPRKSQLFDLLKFEVLNNQFNSAEETRDLIASLVLLGPRSQPLFELLLQNPEKLTPTERKAATQILRNF